MTRKQKKLRTKKGNVLVGLRVQVFIADTHTHTQQARPGMNEKSEKYEREKIFYLVANASRDRVRFILVAMSRLIRLPCGKWTRFFSLEVASSFHGYYRRLLIAINYLIVIYCKSFSWRHVDLVSRARFCFDFVSLPLAHPQTIENTKKRRVLRASTVIRCSINRNRTAQ